MAEKRIFGYDALKALAAFFVVLYHCGMVDFGYQDGVYYYPTLVQFFWLFTACGVPLFFTVNGALTVSRKYDFKKTAIKTVRLLLIALFWGFIVRCVYGLRYHKMPTITIGSLHYYWFLYSLAYFYIINYALSLFPRWCRWVCVTALLVFPFITNFIWNIIIYIDPSTAMPKWGHVGVYTMYGLVYLYAGDYFAHNKVKKYLPLLCIIIGLALLLFEVTAVVNYKHHQYAGANYAFPSLGTLFLTIGIFVWLKEIDLRDSWLKRYIVFLGNNALGIYIFHMMLMAIVGGLLKDPENITIHPIFVIMIAIGYTTLSALISELIRRTPLAFLLKL